MLSWRHLTPTLSLPTPCEWQIKVITYLGPPTDPRDSVESALSFEVSLVSFGYIIKSSLVLLSLPSPERALLVSEEVPTEALGRGHRNVPLPGLREPGGTYLLQVVPLSENTTKRS